MKNVRNLASGSASRTGRDVGQEGGLGGMGGRAAQVIVGQVRRVGQVRQVGQVR
ncbi:hypothetical protein [Capnocytophaga leadbetteri]|uniref:hypothetical protein n=1 Tax=Capnocytophaga leadbetteri TaxID=327575 RepID=UPI0028D89FE7|nr:hypothetical protein [Capnocytophaga leadbetteri]